MVSGWDRRTVGPSCKSGCQISPPMPEIATKTALFSNNRERGREREKIGREEKAIKAVV